MKELRQIKLALIDSDFMTDRVKTILSILDENLKELSCEKSNNYFLFYKNKELIFYYFSDTITEIYINYNIPKQLSRIIEIDNDIKLVMRWYMERTYKFDLSNTIFKVFN